MKVRYVADDGTLFETEKECEAYELSQTFGADTRFVNVVDDMFYHLVSTDDRGNPVIPFETEEEKIKVSIAIARNFQKLEDAYDTISAPKPKAKTGKVSGTQALERKLEIAKNRIRTVSRMYDEDDEE
jgi:hypothetical protein